jgi:hypothetical protein
MGFKSEEQIEWNFPSSGESFEEKFQKVKEEIKKAHNNFVSADLDDDFEKMHEDFVKEVIVMVTIFLALCILIIIFCCLCNRKERRNGEVYESELKNLF